MKTLKIDCLNVKVFPSRLEMGIAAAKDAASLIRTLLSQKEEINCVFAAAPSQNDVLAALVQEELPWERIRAYHMDEYVGLTNTHPASFGQYLRSHIFSLVPFKSVHYIASDTVCPAEELCQAYSWLLAPLTIDIVFMGVGENGHIAFNDPGEADIHDTALVKIVNLDEVCRMQQVHDGCFPNLDAVPRQAVTLTIPMFLRAGHLINVVPTALKAPAVKAMLYGEISEACPASVCRTHPGATLYLDQDSASLL